jgi:hypothetical protein
MQPTVIIDRGADRLDTGAWLPYAERAWLAEVVRAWPGAKYR